MRGERHRYGLFGLGNLLFGVAVFGVGVFGVLVRFLASWWWFVFRIRAVAGLGRIGVQFGWRVGAERGKPDRLHTAVGVASRAVLIGQSSLTVSTVSRVTSATG